MIRRTARYFFVSEYVPKNWSPGAVGADARRSVTNNFRSMEFAVAQRDEAEKKRGFFALPSLDYDTSAGIPPLFSKQQFDLQYQFFHRDAVDVLNTHTIGSELEGHNLDVVIHKTAFDATRAVVHSSAAEHFNYCFWYKCLRPWGTAVPERLRNSLQLLLNDGHNHNNHNNTGRNDSHGNHVPTTDGHFSAVSSVMDPVGEITRRMTIKALTQQDRCGWVYLVWTGKKFDVEYFEHGLCPISSDLIPLLCINIHESAFNLDYGEEKFESYIKNFFKTCNWIVADYNYGGAIEKP